MQISQKLTNGFAWAGVVLVVGVLAVDFATAQMSTPVVDQIAEVRQPTFSPLPASARPKPVTVAATSPVAAAKPVAAKPAAAPGVVDRYLASGKPLPAYISGGSQPVATAAKPAAVAPPASVATAPVTDPVQVGSISPRKTAPIPMPLSMRPKPPAPLIIDEARIAPIAPPPVVSNAGDDVIDATDLADWEYGPLSDFLARKRGKKPKSNYDPNGFFLNQAPNSLSNNRYVGPVDDSVFYPFND